MMKLRILVSLPVALSLLALTAGHAGQNSDPGPTVAICHRIGSAGNTILLTIPQNALPAHLAHGDFYPILGTHCEGVPPPEE